MKLSRYAFLLIFPAILVFFFLSVSFSVDKKLKVLNTINALGEDSLSGVFDNYLTGLYNEMNLSSLNLSYQVFKKAMVGYFNLKGKGHLSGKNIISIIDFEQPSTQKRLWVLDISGKKVHFHTLVAHGKNSGENLAVNYSDNPHSNMSSLGFYVTENTYQGKHGLSLILSGKDEGFNSNAKKRSVVMHGADYVSEEFIKCNGRLGRSHGCPALSRKDHAKIINEIKDGSALFIYYPQPGYCSEYLNFKFASEEFSKEYRK